MRNIKYALLFAVLFAALSSLNVFAGEIATYEIQWEYSITNGSDKTIMQVPFGFNPGTFALESSYQPDTDVSQHMTTSTNEPQHDYGFAKIYKTDIQAGETQSIGMTWTFNSGDFDQRLYNSASQELISVEPFLGKDELVELTLQLINGLSDNRAKALAIYTWITQNIKYGEEQSFALPETANCQTFANLFSNMCRIAEIPCRKVYGYSIRLVDSEGLLTYGTIDISDNAMHVWNEFYDELSGWVIADSTFDAGKSEFEFFMQGSSQYPHLAMFYDKLLTFMTSTDDDRELPEWIKKITITRSEFTGSYSQDENALASYQRIESERKMLEQFFSTQGVSFQINRITDNLSWSENILSIPAKYKVLAHKSDTLEISYDKKVILQLQFSEDGSWRLLYMPD